MYQHPKRDGRSQISAHKTNSQALPLPGFSAAHAYKAQHFVRQTLYYVLREAKALLVSFLNPKYPRRVGEALSERSLARPEYLDNAFRLLLPYRDIVLQSLGVGLNALYSPPPEITQSGIRKLKRGSSVSVSACSDSMGESTIDDNVRISYLNDLEASHILLIAIHGVMADIPWWTWSRGGARAVRILRFSGDLSCALPADHWKDHGSALLAQTRAYLDAIEDETPLRFAGQICRAVAARLHYERILELNSARGSFAEGSDGNRMGIIDILRNHYATSQDGRSTADAARKCGHDLSTKPSQSALTEDSRLWSMPTAIVERLRGVLINEWDGKEEVDRLSAVGGAIAILSELHNDSNRLGLDPDLFYMPFLRDRLDPLSTPVEWFNTTPRDKTLHLLSFPFLFFPATLVTYFRAINFHHMSRAFEAALVTCRQLKSHYLPDPRDTRERSVLRRLETAMSVHLVLDIRRDHVLEDAFDQLWRRQKRELVRPLKVRLGTAHGEEGVDHGGVQQEFFAIAFEEALRPEYGLFTTDPETQVSWFQPCTLEPLFKFEMVGLLLSLAIYNGVTVPVSFPEVLYRKLLGGRVQCPHQIHDGWPVLSKGLNDLLEWADGDVEEVYSRTYEFSFEAWGRQIHVDMQNPEDSNPLFVSSWPETSCRSSGGWDIATSAGGDHRLPGTTGGADASFVTNANRHQYVEDYLYWLTDRSIGPQYDAFARGFFSCLDKKAVSVFTPEALQAVVEGTQEVNVSMLWNITRYEGGYHADHPLIREFWRIVQGYTSNERRQLLEFVTASDRVPVNGISSILFVVQRNGPDSERIPTSLTCFGRLLLPEYESGQKLKEKLRVALENGKGFGVP
ncbi:MAG: hypothetical protein M1817_003107 [Caeruleum heppii]|nr:MAG: hypothetical protein M1817_003107 [Caeruleum heppii]